MHARTYARYADLVGHACVLGVQLHLEFAAEGGSSAGAMALGQRYAKGIGVDKDCMQAFYLLAQAADAVVVNTPHIDSKMSFRYVISS